MIFKTIRSTLLAAVGAAAVLSAFPLAASASVTSTHSSANWAGYVATTPNAQPDQFGYVQATFVVPKVSCSDSTMGNRPPNSAGWYAGAGFWVGLGGVGSNLEQDGVVVICANKTSSPAYSAFYEMVPLQPSAKYIGLYTSTGKHVVIHAGDTIKVSTKDAATGTSPYKPGQRYQFLITDTTQHAKSRIPLQSFGSGKLGSDKTVEVITEALNDGPWSSFHTGLAHFQPVKYTGVSVSYISAGYSYGIGTAGSATTSQWTLGHGSYVLIKTSGLVASSDPTAPVSFTNTWNKLPPVWAR